MTNPDDLPDVLEATWSFDQIHNLFHDLAQGAKVRRVQVRGRTNTGNIADTAMSLDEAHCALTEGNVKAIQIWYQYEDTHWCDTLMVHSDAVRIIRSVVPDPS